MEGELSYIDLVRASVVGLRGLVSSGVWTWTGLLVDTTAPAVDDVEGVAILGDAIDDDTEVDAVDAQQQSSSLFEEADVVF